MSFDNEADPFVILVNDEEQYSLWPAKKATPDGWKVDYGPSDRADCLSYVEKTWIDMRPRTLREAMARASN